MEYPADYYLELIDRQIDNQHLLSHPFYQAWSAGLLSLECLCQYALEYYQHVKAFPRYLSALHSHTDDMATRKMILSNLVDEEAGSPNHPDLWRSFAIALGVDPTLLDIPFSSPIDLVIANFESLCRDGSVAEGLAALYTYESQIPSVSISKIQGLRAYYGMKNPSDWEYFTVHIAADEEHAAVERKLLANHLKSNEVANVQAAVQSVLNGLWGFLSSLCERYEVDLCPTH